MSHARLAPSASSRWTQCPGSVALIESLPPDQRDVPNASAIRGTALHDVLAECLENQTSPQARVGHSVWVDTDDGIGTSHEFTAADAAAVNVVINHVQRRIQEYGQGTLFMVEERLEAGAAFHTATFNADTLEVDYLPIPESEGLAAECWGRGDVVLIGGGFIEVIDAKFGRKHVDPVDNSQLLLYLLGALKHITPDQAPQRARLTIVQPNGEREGVEPVRTWEFPRDEDQQRFDDIMLEQAAKFGDAAKLALSANAPRVPGDSQCRWCPAKPVCPEVAKAATDALTGALAETSTPLATAMEGAGVSAQELLETVPGANGAGTPLDTPGGLVEALTREPGELTPEQRGVVLDAEEMVLSWLRAVKAYALKEALRGHPTPRWKVVAGRRSREWLDEEAARKKLAGTKKIGDDGKASSKLRKDQYLVEKLITPKQAEDNLRPMLTDRAWKAIAELWEWKEGKDTLAPETDTRAAKTIMTTEEALAATPGSAAPDAEPDWLS